MKLETEFTGKGDCKNNQFKLLDRKDDIAIYSRTNQHGDKSFEVIKIKRTTSDWVIKGKIVAPAGQENYPATSTWGSLGFSFDKLEKAQEKLKELVENQHD